MWPIKLIALFLVILALTICLVFVSSRRDSSYYDLLSRVIAPVSVLFLPSQQPDPVPITESFNNSEIDKSWKWYKPELVTSRFDGGGLIVDTITESVWFNNVRGPMLYRYFDGDGEISVTVKTRKSSDRSSYPDTQWQFGGIIFRDPAGDAWFTKENYVFNVIGFRQKGSQIETKSTSDGNSNVSGFNWDSGDAELLIQRHGATFTLKARPVGHDVWQDMVEYVRADLPPLLQVGIIVYSYSYGKNIYDLSVEFDNLALRSL